LNLRNRILRNEQDGSPGGGSSPAAPAAPAAPPSGGNGGAPPPPFDPGSIKSAVVEAFGELRNGLFADLRKAGALKPDKQNEATQQPAPSSASPAPAANGVSLDDVKRLLGVKDAAAMLRYERGASPAQIRHFEQMCEFTRPDDPATFAKSWADDLGISKAAPATAQPAQAPAIPTAPAQPPISDKGSPAPGGVLDWEREYAENPIGMSPAARQRMDAKYGAEKARKMRLEAAQRQAEQIRVTRPQG
jgi:hypothetical protein